MEYKKEYLYKRVVKAKLFLDKEFAENIDLDAVILEANLSKYHFIRLFKQMFAVTPHQYLIRRRIKEAIQLLINTETSVSEVCEDVGFNSPSSFCILFKKIIGQTPLEYRRNYVALEMKRKKSPLSHIPGCYSLVHELVK